MLGLGSSQLQQKAALPAARTPASPGNGAPARDGEGSLSKIGWLRAAVLGANDGIVSIASLIVGVASASGTYNHVLLSGVAGLVAGAMSMAAGEFVSVSSQADTEKAALAGEREKLRADPGSELNELAAIYVRRGVDRKVAHEVALQLTKRDALGAHARDDLGLSVVMAARPVQAALASAISFTCGGAAPLVTVLVAPAGTLVASVSAVSLLCLALLGAVGARTGGANIAKAVWRVAFWGALALAVTAVVGSLFARLGA